MGIIFVCKKHTTYMTHTKIMDVITFLVRKKCLNANLTLIYEEQN